MRTFTSLFIFAVALSFAAVASAGTLTKQATENSTKMMKSNMENASESQNTMNKSMNTTTGNMNTTATNAMNTMTNKVMSPSVVSTVMQAGNFSTLIALLNMAGLSDVLEGNGPFTLFAPTDAAFAKLPQETLESLMQPENREQLKSILTYHVVPNKMTAQEIMGSNAASTVSGAMLPFKSTKENEVQVGSASVVRSDMMSTNGVVHIIDQVLIP